MFQLSWCLFSTLYFLYWNLQTIVSLLQNQTTLDAITGAERALGPNEFLRVEQVNWMCQSFLHRLPSPSNNGLCSKPTQTAKKPKNPEIIAINQQFSHFLLLWCRNLVTKNPIAQGRVNFWIRLAPGSLCFLVMNDHFPALCKIVKNIHSLTENENCVISITFEWHYIWMEKCRMDCKTLSLWKSQHTLRYDGFYADILTLYRRRGVS